MSHLKDNIEFLFERIARATYRNPLKTLVIAFLLIGAFIVQIKDIVIDTNFESLLHEDDPSRVIYQEFIDQFGRSDVVVVVVQSDNIFTESFLVRLQALHRDLEENVPFVDSILSLVNARDTRGEGDVLIVRELLEGFPETPIDMQALKKRVLQNPFYLNNIISEDGRLTAIIIKNEPVVRKDNQDALMMEGFDSEPETESPSLRKRAHFTETERRDIVASANAVIRKYQQPDFHAFVSGSVVVGVFFNQWTFRDMKVCAIAALAVNFIFLLLLFRRFSGVFFPYIVILSSTFCALGLMAVSGVAVKITTGMLPAFLISVGVATSVHILAVFYRNYNAYDNKEEAIVHAMGHSGLAVLMSCLTTAAGLLSFAFAELTAIGEMGVFSAVGVMLAFTFTVVLLPPLIALIPLKRITRKDKKTQVMDRVLLAFANFTWRHPLKILLVCILFGVVATAGLFRLTYSDYVLDFFPKKLGIKEDLVALDKGLNGVINMEIVLDTGAENGIYDPVFLHTIDRTNETVKKIKHDGIFIGNIVSIVDIIREINQALNNNDPAFYTIPHDRELIAQEFLLFENSGSDDLEQIVDSGFRKTRITIKTPWVDNVIFDKFVGRIEQEFNKAFAGMAHVQITGMSAIMGRTIPATMRSMTQSYLTAFIVISLMMIFLVGSFKIGMIGMFPNLLPIAVMMGAGGFLGLPLDMTSLLIGSIAIGLVVDDTLHFIYNYQKFFRKTGDALYAIRETFIGTGRALLITSLTLAGGFFSIVLATLLNNMRFGILTGITILIALVLDFVLTPALMILMTRGKQVPEQCAAESASAVIEKN